MQQQYKDYTSDYRQWDQEEHADDWMLYPDNTGIHLRIDETALSNEELYTILTNKAAKVATAGRKGALVPMIKGTQPDTVIGSLKKIPKRIRAKSSGNNFGHGYQHEAVHRRHG